MADKVKAIPDGYHSITPYLIVRGASRAIEFYKRALGAKELYRLPNPDGTLGHAELQFGNSRIMLSDENTAWGAKSPELIGGSPVGLALYVEDVDALFNRVKDEKGIVIKRPLETQFYGDRSVTFFDPFGHQWTISQHVEDVPPDEMQKRMAKLAQKPA